MKVSHDILDLYSQSISSKFRKKKSLGMTLSKRPKTQLFEKQSVTFWRRATKVGSRGRAGPTFAASHDPMPICVSCPNIFLTLSFEGRSRLTLVLYETTWLVCESEWDEGGWMEYCYYSTFEFPVCLFASLMRVFVILPGIWISKSSSQRKWSNINGR